MKNLNRPDALATSAVAASGAGVATALVTGSDRGLGFEFVRQYAERGWNVIATMRRPEAATALQALAENHRNIVIEKLDVLDERGVGALAELYRGKPIDIVINNAGVQGDLRGQALGSFDHANFLQVMNVNVYGALAVSQAFRENVIQSAQKKFIAISSAVGSISREGGPNFYFYRASKAALNMCMKVLARELQDKGVIVGMVAPGAVNTDMARYVVGAERAATFQSPRQSVESMIKVIDGLTQSNSDKPINYDGSILPW